MLDELLPVVVEENYDVCGGRVKMEDPHKESGENKREQRQLLSGLMMLAMARSTNHETIVSLLVSV